LKKKRETAWVNWLPTQCTYTVGATGPIPRRKLIGVGRIVERLSFLNHFLGIFRKKDPTEQKSPSTTAVIVAGWLNPTYAYADDTSRTRSSSNDGGEEQEYAGYGYSISADATINEFLIQIKGFLLNPGDEGVSIKYWDGTNWYFSVPPFTDVEQFFSSNVTSIINTPAKVNGIKVRIYYWTVPPPGGCFPPLSEFLGWDGTNFKMLKVEDIKVGDLLLGFDASKTPRFFSAKVTSVVKHSGKWKIIRVYFKYPKTFTNLTYQHPQLRQLLNLKKDSEPLCDTAWTDNHPVFTFNRGMITAGELRVGDILGELFHSGKLLTGGVQIENIETFDFEGDVFDVKGESKFIFGRYLIGHLTKEPW